MQEVAPVDDAPVDGGLEDQGVVVAIGTADDPLVVEVLKDPENAAQDRRRDGLALIGLEDHRAGESHVLGEEGDQGLRIVGLNGPAERVHHTSIVNFLNRYRVENTSAQPPCPP